MFAWFSWAPLLDTFLQQGSLSSTKFSRTTFPQTVCARCKHILRRHRCFCVPFAAVLWLQRFLRCLAGRLSSKAVVVVNAFPTTACPQSDLSTLQAHIAPCRPACVAFQIFAVFVLRSLRSSGFMVIFVASLDTFLQKGSLSSTNLPRTTCPQSVCARCKHILRRAGGGRHWGGHLRA